MVDNLTPEDRRKTMRAVKGKGTSLERRLSAMLAGMGLSGWKKNVSDIAGKPDVVFPRERVLIFIDGCFWHGCPHCKRKLPQTNREYWESKIKRNVERDERNTQTLVDDGWRVMRVWEHEMQDAATRSEIRSKIRQAIEGREEN
jgi:DNA mismatch endonuclease (patch repair protein)